MNTEQDVKDAVQKTYGAIARKGGQSCCAPSCCSSSGPQNLTPETISKALGYSEADVSAVPDGANLGLGCGNPQAIAALKPGEVVLDLGSGGGFDCFLAARQVGVTGRVIGVDMTEEMVALARGNAVKTDHSNVEFRLGEIEQLPVGDAEIDVILSNCVVNLSPNKRAVFSEAFRVLKPGGRLAISDIVATAELPEEIARDLALHSGCIAGAAQLTEIETLLAGVGFVDVAVRADEASRAMIDAWVPGVGAGRYVVSARIEGRKPHSPVVGKRGERSK